MNNQWKREFMDKGGNKRNNTSSQVNRRVRGGMSSSFYYRGGNQGRNQVSGKGFGRFNNFPDGGRGRGRYNQRGNYNYRNVTGRNYSPLHPDEECRLHGGHKWRNCIYNPRRENNTRALVGRAAPITGAARGARYGRGRTSEESHFMGRIVNGPSDGSQTMIPNTGESYQLTIQADGNQ